MNHRNYSTPFTQRAQQALEHIGRIFQSNTPALINLKPLQVTFGVSAGFLVVLTRLGVLTREREGITGYRYTPTALFYVLTGDDLIGLERLRTDSEYAGELIDTLHDRVGDQDPDGGVIPVEAAAAPAELEKPIIKRTRGTGENAVVKYQTALDDLRKRFTDANGVPVRITAENFQSIHHVGSSMPTVLRRMGFIRQVGNPKACLYVPTSLFHYLTGRDIISIETLRTDETAQQHLLDEVHARAQDGPTSLPAKPETWADVFDKLPADSKVSDPRPTEFSIVHSSDLPTEEQIRGSYDAGVQDTRAKVYNHLMDASRAAFSQEDDVIALLLRTMAKEYKD